MASHERTLAAGLMQHHSSALWTGPLLTTKLVKREHADSEHFYSLSLQLLLRVTNPIWPPLQLNPIHKTLIYVAFPDTANIEILDQLAS